MADMIAPPKELLPYYQQAAASSGVPIGVLLGRDFQESGFNPQATGAAGEWGISQIMPSTAAQPGYGLAPLSRADAYDPSKAIPWSAQYMAQKAKAVGGVTDWSDPAQQLKGLAAYNGAGPAAQQYAQTVASHIPRTVGTPVTALGDSIAQGFGQANGYNVQAKVGDSPQAVLDRINGLPEDGVKGHTVLLSSGASNNPQQLTLVQQQIKALMDRGAAGVRLYGVGPAVGNGVNDGLRQIAADTGATFSPLPQTGKDGVHPASYRIAGSRAQVQGQASSVSPSISVSAPSSSGLGGLLPSGAALGVQLGLPSMPLGESASPVSPLLALLQQQQLQQLKPGYQALKVDYDPWKLQPDFTKFNMKV